MSVTLVSTVGSASANSYASNAEADAYFNNRLNTTAWGSDEDAQNRALIMACRRLDQESFIGYPVDTTQALKWPRAYAPKPDPVAWWEYFSTTEIPQKLKDAQCELALTYLNAGTTDAAAPTGLENFKELRVGPISMVMNQPVSAGRLPDEVMRLLSGLVIGSGQAVIVRG